MTQTGTETIYKTICHYASDIMRALSLLIKCLTALLAVSLSHVVFHASLAHEGCAHAVYKCKNVEMFDGTVRKHAMSTFTHIATHSRAFTRNYNAGGAQLLRI